MTTPTFSPDLRPRVQSPPDPDPEIGAIETCLKALLPLDHAARSRALEYLDDRLKPRDDEVSE